MTDPTEARVALRSLRALRTFLHVLRPAVLAAGILLLASGPAGAGSARAPGAQPGAAKRGVADTVTVLPTVKVEGQHHSSDDRETATSVRMQRSQLTRFLPATVGDALTSVPGVDLVKTGPWAARVSLRGLSGDRVVVLVDGVRLNSVRGHGVQPSMVSLDKLDAVEVSPGASSAQFGSDAMGGVVNLVTHRSLFDPTRRLGLIAQVRGYGPGASFSQQLRTRYVSPRFGLEAWGGVGALDALVTPAGRVANSGDREEDYGVRGGFKWGVTDFDYEHSHHAARDVGLPAFGNDAGSTGSYPLQGRDTDRLEFNAAGAGLRPQSQVLLVRQALATDFTETVVDTLLWRGNPRWLKTTVANDRVRTVSQSLLPTFRFAAPFSPRLNFELRRETTDGPRYSHAAMTDLAGNPAGTPLDSIGHTMPAAWRNTWSAALSGGSTLRPDGIAAGIALRRVLPGFLADPLGAAVGALGRTRLDGGLRYDLLRSHADAIQSPFDPTQVLAVSDLTDRRFSAEGGLSRVFGAVEPYAHVASGFRAPNLEERYYFGSIHGGMRLFGNEDLRPERSVSYEGGLRITEPFPWLTALRVSAYRSEVEDLISFKYILFLYGEPRFQYQNVKRARIEGMEYAAEARAGRVKFALAAGFPRGFDMTSPERPTDPGARRRLTDVGTGRVTLDLVVPVDRWVPQGMVSTRLRWNDAVWTADTLLYRPRFTTLNVEGAFTVGEVRTTLAVRNLANSNYREPQSFIYEPGRTFAVSFRRDFDLPVH